MNLFFRLSAVRTYLLLVFLAFFCRIHPVWGNIQEQEPVKLDGTWYREDGEARQLVSIPEGLKLITPTESYIYYKAGENTYQMHWTPGNQGQKYRWTLIVKNQNLFENIYENETYPGTITYKYTRVLK